MKPQRAIVAIAILAAAFGIPACDEEPLRTVGYPPIIEDYRPVDSLLVVELGEALTFSVDAVDPDGDRLSQSFSVDGVVVSHGTTWRYVVADTGMATVGFVVSDGEYEAKVEWRLSRRHVNRPPMIQSFQPVSPTLDMAVGDAIEFSIDTADPDGDPVEHFFRIDGVLVSTDASVVFAATRPGRIAVEAFVWDGSLVATHRWVIVVEGPPVNRPPTIYSRVPVNDAPAVQMGSDIEFSIHAYDPDGDTLAYLFLVDGTEAAFASVFEFPTTEPGTFEVTASVSDGEFSSATTWMVTVIANHPPELVNFAPSAPSLQVTAGTQVGFSADAVDSDGDPLMYSYRLDGVLVHTGKSFLYSADRAGNYDISVDVTDGELTTSHAWQVAVVEEVVNHPPMFSAYSPGDVDVAGIADVGVEFLVQAVDPDGDAIEVSFHVDGVRVSTGTSFTYVGSVGSYTIEARVTDGALSATHTWRLTLFDPTASLRGRLRDAVTGTPLAGVSVEIALHESTTDALGQFEFSGVPPFGRTLTVRDEPDEGTIGEYFDYVHLFDSQDGNYLEIFLLPNIPVASVYYSDFHQLYRVLTDTYGIPPSTQQRRFELPIDVYVPAFTQSGLDYRQTVVDVTAEFDQILGVPMFNVVGQRPDVGVEIVFSPTVSIDNYQTLEWTPDYYPRRGRIEFRTVFAPSTAEAFQRVIRHEFGHALGLGHSADRLHLMIGGQSPRVAWFSEDELSVIHAHYNIPRGHEMLDHIRD